MGEYLFRTAVTGLEFSPSQCALLEETIAEWLRGCQLAVDIGWKRGLTARSELQPVLYNRIREETQLKSEHTLLAIRQASDALVSIEERRQRRRPASKPVFTSPTIKYDSRTMTLFDDETVSLTTTKDRVRCPLRLPADEDGYQWQYLQSEDWQLAESNLTNRTDTFRLHLRFKSDAPDPDCSEAPRVIGVDLGIENIAVTSTAYFAPGGELVHTHEQFEEARRGLQETDSMSARRTLQQRGNREDRHICDRLHCISKDLVSEAETYNCRYIAFENLRYIRDRVASKKVHRWAHQKLVRYVEYKARERGIEVVFVDPENTSRRCNDCGFTSEENRPDRDTFRCARCGKSANADYNAAKKIGWRFVRRGQQSSRRTGHRQLALKSLTVTPNRGFIPYPEDGSEAEDTDKTRAVRLTNENSSVRDS